MPANLLDLKHNMRLIQIIVLVMLSLIALNDRSYSQNPTSASAKLFAVIFAYVVSEEGELKSFRAFKVIDPRSGNTDAVDVTVPENYIAAARARSRPRTIRLPLSMGN